MNTIVKKTSTIQLKPGYLVSLKSSIRGGVTYTREDVDPEAFTAGEGRDVSAWKTTKIVEDAEEHERARKACGKALAMIRKLCIRSDFGLLCPLALEAELGEAIAAARILVEQFNETAKFSRVRIFALRGRIASTDEEAMRGIGDEVRGLVAQMNDGIGKLDPEAIRDAASRARELSAMLSEEQAEVVSEAVKQARAAARAITARVEKDGEAAAVVLADIKRGAIEKARIAFLDIDGAEPVAATEPAPAADVNRVAGLDLGSEVH